MGSEDTGRLTLEKVRLGLRQVMSDELLADMEASAIPDYLAAGTIFAFQTYLMGNTVHTERETYQHPATWWQGFKEACFPDWLKGHYPVRYTEVVIMTKFTHVCPHLNIATREDERFHLQWLTPPRGEGL